MEHVYIPQVGDIVSLSDVGLEVAFGTRLGLSHMKQLRMCVTETECIDHGNNIFTVKVDNPEINQYLLYDECFDFVSK